MKNGPTRVHFIAGPSVPTRVGNAVRLAFIVLCGALSVAGWSATPSRALVQAAQTDQDLPAAPVVAQPIAPSDAFGFTQARWQNDIAAMKAFRPGYSFWQNIFTIPDGSIAFGRATDGQLIAVFPTHGDWQKDGRFTDPALASVLEGRQLSRNLDERRDEVVGLLEQVVGPLLHNPTRGLTLLPNAKRYGSVLEQWGAIYERFGVPAEVGLAQAILESGLDGARRSEAGAIGLCQWLKGNWKVLDKLAPATIEAKNQTTQAPYCAAYLTVLATKYQSFIPALSEHHSGGTNVGRVIINGERLGGVEPRERYFLGADLARDLRSLESEKYRDLYRTYGPRSYRYAEMTFGNGEIIRRLTRETPQSKIYAMRTSRAIPIDEIRRRTFLPESEIRRFNPALVKKVPASATVYLPLYVKELGRDVSFWQRRPDPVFVATLNDFVRLDAPVERWENPSFEPVLRAFQRRFAATNTEEGSVMAAMLAYVSQEAYKSERSAILSEFRTSQEIRELFTFALREREAVRAVNAGGSSIN